MGSISNESLIQILTILLIVTVAVIVILLIILLAINIKEKRANEKKKKDTDEPVQVNKAQIIYTPESILDFMDFERVEDNMIIQKNGKFLMIVECKGINYDLMSEMEKVSVEQGFIAFLNTLRYPIQLYIQTRTINLESSIDGYKAKLKNIDQKYNNVKTQYEKTLKEGRASRNNIDKIKYELIKQRNLKEYTTDIIRDIERQSLNRNILSKKYYIVIPCYKAEIATGDFDDTEVQNMAFSELYTRSRAMINSLFACQVAGKILNSEEITELLYMAYNRDEADLFWMDKLKQAGLDELYSTAPDVMDKKLKLLDKRIEDEAIALANEKINEAKNEKEMEIMDKEKNEGVIVNRKAKALIRKHRRYIGEEIAGKAMDKIKATEEEESKSTKKDKEGANNVNI